MPGPVFVFARFYFFHICLMICIAFVLSEDRNAYIFRYILLNQGGENMRICHDGIVLLGLLLLCSASVAADTQISLHTDQDWLVAGSGGTATVTATVTNATTGSPLSGETILFNATFGTVSPSAVTDGNGIARATFTVGTKSGTAAITARAPDGATATALQQIDHGTPYTLAFRDYESEATVGSEMPIVLAMEDRFGNRIDNRRETESVAFSVGSPDGSAVFVGSGSDTVVSPVDGNGNVTATLRLGRTAGENVVYVNLPAPVADAYFTFYGISDAPPVSITPEVSPDNGDPPWVYADGKHAFTIICTLKDALGNPSINRSVLFTALPGEETTLRSNADGQILFTYGPKDSTGKVTITATSADNASVTCSQTVEFASTAPVDMLLSASPQTMPSLDVSSGQTAEIRAKVMDVKGNPVEGQTVTFSLSDISTTGSDPSLESTSSVTDEDGYAVVRFTPGSFPLSYQNGIGTCNVTAVWTSVTRTLPLTWMNCPYLSVATSVDPETVGVNETVNVTITLTGDGYKLQPTPIDVVLVMDTSGSMAWDDSGHNPSRYETSRLEEAQAAAKDFVGQMNFQNDRVGLVEFASDADVVQDLTDDQNAVDTKIDRFRADGATNMREALYLAIKELKTDGRSDAVKAVVLMSDGEWNYDGSPLGHGTGYPDSSSWVYTFSGNSLEPDHYCYYDGLGGTLLTGQKYVSSWWSGGYYRDYEYCTDGESTNQNMSIYANNNHVRLYTIGFASDLSAVEPYLTRLSGAANGSYTWAGNEEELKEVYTTIAGELKTEAGVNTAMDISFQNVEVNGTPVLDGREVFTYLHIPDVSTNIESWIDNETGYYEIVPLHTEDQTADWADDLNLHFDIGTVHINQTWTATYTLKVLAPGNIKIFGHGSTISFNNGTETLALPDTFVTGVPDLNNTGLNTAALDVSNLRRNGSGQITDFLPLTWMLNYTGNKTVTQRLFYSSDEKHTWTEFAALTSRSPVNGTQNASLDVREMPAGHYWIRVRATAPDAPPAEDQTPYYFAVGGTGTAKIKLE